MKKIICLLLCVVFACLAFAGCENDEIGEDLKNRVTDTGNNDKLEVLNFYIVTDEAVDNAKKTVSQSINTYLKDSDDYKVELNIVYCTAAEYDAKVHTAASSATESERADVVLINSKALFDKLYNDKLLLNLNNFYDSKPYESLKGAGGVEPTLLAASAVAEEVDGKLTSSYYTVPNNHKIGEYTYVVINKEKVVDTVLYPEYDAMQLKTEESLTVLKAAIENYWVRENIPESERVMDDYVKIVSGMEYSDKQLLEYGVSDFSEITEQSKKVNIVNVSAYPTATPEEAFSAAFAIVKNTNDIGDNDEATQDVLDSHYKKCMNIIYGLNTDVELKNMLQYGYVGLNYKFNRDSSDTVERLFGEDSTYKMNPAYTGNLYITYYCEELGWTKTTAESIETQNTQSYTLQQKMNAELANLTIENVEVDEAQSIFVAVNGILHGDVTFVYTSDSDYAIVDGGVIDITLPAEDTVANITVDIYVGNVLVGAAQSFQIQINAPQA